MENNNSIRTPENKMKNIQLKIEANQIDLLAISDLEYQLSFTKSLSNIKTTSDILPLVVEQLVHVRTTYDIADDTVNLTYHLNKDDKSFDKLKHALRYKKLHVLKNMEYFFSLLEKGYTYILHPDNLVYNDNMIPRSIYVGYVKALEPLHQTEEQLLHQFKCLVFSTLDNTQEFEKLANGALEYTKKTTFLERVYSAATHEELFKFLDESFQKEYAQYHHRNIAVNKKQYSRMRIIAVVASVFGTIAIALAFFALMVQIPFKDKMNESTTYFISSDFGNVIRTLYNEDTSNLPQAQKYMLAHSYILEEPMSPASRTSALNSISTNSDPRFLDFWIYMGRLEYEKALDIAKVLTDLNLEYHATFRAIEILKADATISGTEKETKIRDFTSKLADLEEKLFIPPTTTTPGATTTPTAPVTPSPTGGANGN